MLSCMVWICSNKKKRYPFSFVIFLSHFFFFIFLSYFFFVFFLTRSTNKCAFRDGRGNIEVEIGNLAHRSHCSTTKVLGERKVTTNTTRQFQEKFSSPPPLTSLPLYPHSPPYFLPIYSPPEH